MTENKHAHGEKLTNDQKSKEEVPEQIIIDGVPVTYFSGVYFRLLEHGQVYDDNHESVGRDSQGR